MHTVTRGADETSSFCYLPTTELGPYVFCFQREYDSRICIPISQVCDGEPEPIQCHRFTDEDPELCGKYWNRTNYTWPSSLWNKALFRASLGAPLSVKGSPYQEPVYPISVLVKLYLGAPWPIQYVATVEPFYRLHILVNRNAVLM